jgi:ssDNA-binding Zn-finger/Zn-ribbon topoisomerase 1
LDRQIAGLEKQFIDQGGYSERLYAARIEERQKQDRSDQSDPTNRTDRTDQKPCPACDRAMVLRTARKGPKAGSRFWGCSGYPGCKATLPVD